MNLDYLQWNLYGDTYLGSVDSIDPNFLEWNLFGNSSLFDSDATGLMATFSQIMAQGSASSANTVMALSVNISGEGSMTSASESIFSFSYLIGSGSVQSGGIVTSEYGYIIGQGSLDSTAGITAGISIASIASTAVTGAITIAWSNIIGLGSVELAIVVPFQEAPIIIHSRAGIALVESKPKIEMITSKKGIPTI